MSAEPQHLADLNNVAEIASVATNARQLSVAQILKRASRIIAVFIAARLLGVETFGVYALILTVTEMVAVLTGAGYIDFLTREIARQPQQARRITTDVVVLRLIYLAPMTMIALAVLWLLRFPVTSVQYAALLSISLLPRAMSEPAQGLLKGLGRFSPLPWAELLQGLVLVALVIGLVLRGAGIHGVITAEIISASVGCAFLVAAAWMRSTPAQSSGRRLREVMAATWPFSIFPFIGNLYDRADVVVLSRLAGNFATGIYSVPYRIYASFQIIPASVMGAWLPVFSASPQEARTQCGRALKPLYAVSLLLVLATLAYSRVLVLWVMGTGYIPSVTVMKIVIWSIVPAFISYGYTTLFVALRHEKIYLLTATVCTIFNLGANILLIPRYSFIAAASVTLATELLVLGQNLLFARKLLGHFVLPEKFALITLEFIAMLGLLLALSMVLPEPVAGTIACALFLLLVYPQLGGARALFAARSATK